MDVGIRVEDSDETGEETKMSTVDFDGRRTFETDRIGTNEGRSVSSTLRVIQRPLCLSDS